MRHLRFVLALSAIAALAACAQGTSDGISGHPDAHRSTQPDTNFQTTPDASVFSFPDARIDPPADAYVPPTPDAAGGGGGGICTGSADCTDPTAPCCIDITGSGVGLCFADPGIPGVCLP